MMGLPSCCFRRALVHVARPRVPRWGAPDVQPVHPLPDCHWLGRPDCSDRCGGASVGGCCCGCCRLRDSGCCCYSFDCCCSGGVDSLRLQPEAQRLLRWGQIQPVRYYPSCRFRCCRFRGRVHCRLHHIRLRHCDGRIGWVGQRAVLPARHGNNGRRTGNSFQRPHGHRSYWRHAPAACISRQWFVRCPAVSRPDHSNHRRDLHHCHPLDHHCCPCWGDGCGCGCGFCYCCCYCRVRFSWNSIITIKAQPRIRSLQVPNRRCGVKIKSREQAWSVYFSWFSRTLRCPRS